MINIIVSDHVYLACGATDLRRSIDGLAAIVQMKFKLDPFSKCLFVFCNRSRDRIKILKWDGSGYWLLLKRLEKSTFKWPQDASEIKKVTTKELSWILDGLSVEQPKAFKDRKPTYSV
jgi:transposase